jgi:hypothetical protein
MVDSTFIGYYSLILGESYFNSKITHFQRSNSERELDYLRFWELVTKLQSEDLWVIGFITDRFKTF